MRPPGEREKSFEKGQNKVKKPLWEGSGKIFFKRKEKSPKMFDILTKNCIIVSRGFNIVKLPVYH